MKPETNEKIGRGLLTSICFTAYIFILVSILADALNESVYHFMLG
jgi:hypothetical protein